ncbi:MAG TPA: hypothetical protein VEB66_02355 [Opitutaceae bacterium]|nr:hypothetical protein [Opitutaceae bacterium]
MTTSGKTFAAIQSARDFRRQGVGVLVLHKPREPWPSDAASWQTDDPDRFLRMFWAAKSCACFMELADADVEASDTRFHKCFTQGRHEGHRCYFLSQRAAQVHPNIRENCTSLCLFAVSTKAAKLWAEEFADDALLGASALNPAEHSFFYIPSRGVRARKMRLSS